MIAKILTDNTPCGELCGEWGLSVYIEYGGHRYLLDTGESDLFLQNARKMNVPVEAVEAGVLSHAHHDHANGMAAFFEANSRAPFYLRREARCKCYDRGDEPPRYIGIRDGILDRYADRTVYVDGDAELNPGVHLIGHRTPGLEREGERANMYLPEAGGWTADAFAHEQSLAFETDGGIILFSSCSHAGADNILREMAVRFPGKPVRAMIGGLHLYKRSEDEVRDLARRMRATGVRKVVTGHCTGDAAIAVLREELGGAVETFYCGKEIAF